MLSPGGPQDAFWLEDLAKKSLHFGFSLEFGAPSWRFARKLKPKLWPQASELVPGPGPYTRTADIRFRTVEIRVRTAEVRFRDRRYQMSGPQISEYWLSDPDRRDQFRDRRSHIQNRRSQIQDRRSEIAGPQISDLRTSDVRITWVLVREFKVWVSTARTKQTHSQTHSKNRNQNHSQSYNQRHRQNRPEGP